jgi:hypothetical protein
LHNDANGTGLPAWILEAASGRHSTDICLRALTMLSSGHSQTQVGKELGIPRSTVGLWARRAKEEGGLPDIVEDGGSPIGDNVVEFVRMPDPRPNGSSSESDDLLMADPPLPGQGGDFLSGFLDTYAGGTEAIGDTFGFDDLTSDDAAPVVSPSDSIRVIEGARTILSVQLIDPFPDEHSRSLLEASVRRSLTSALRRSGAAEIDATLLRDAAGLHGTLVAIAGEETDRWPGGVCTVATSIAVFRFAS